jgi:hypothetical protein
MQVEAEGEVATAFTLARMLSHIPLTRGGPASIVIFDIHALQVRSQQEHTAAPVDAATLQYSTDLHHVNMLCVLLHNV